VGNKIIFSGRISARNGEGGIIDEDMKVRKWI